MPVAYFEVQNMRPFKGQYHMSAMVIWSLVPGELNGNILKFLSVRTIRFKLVSKRAKSAVKGEKGLIFIMIGE
jgi:hypothetical protein